METWLSWLILKLKTFYNASFVIKQKITQTLLIQCSFVWMYPKIHISYVFPLAFKRHYANDVFKHNVFICIQQCERKQNHSWLKKFARHVWQIMIMFNKMQFLTNLNYDYFVHNHGFSFLCINPKIIVIMNEWKSYVWIKEVIMQRTLTMLNEEVNYWVKALIFVCEDVLEWIVAVCELRVMVRVCLV